MAFFHTLKTSFSTLIKIAGKIILILILTEIVLGTTGILLLTYYRHFVYSKIPLLKDEHRILFIGESTTCGDGSTNKQTDSYPAQLERILNSQTPRNRFRSINIGFGGLTTEHMLRDLKENIYRYKPDIVVIQAGFNNCSPSLFTLFKGQSLPAAWRKIVIMKLEMSRTYRLMKWAYESVWKQCLLRYLQNRGFTPTSNPGFWVTDMYPEEYQITKVESEIHLCRMIEILREHNIPLVLCGYFIAEDENIMLRRLSKTYAVPFCDNELEDTPFNRKEYISVDQFHPNTNGYFLIAQNLFKTLTDHHLIPETPSDPSTAS
ncbi:MAG TPA: SGNH/GDSL hydrolase family protein [Elusimicrobiota bacterium]|nr:SGNH/GDSL hydrolase family protein [Elusimicrobiota bacterium]